SWNEHESLWEYLHRTNLELWSPRNRFLTPVFVLDQFEEAFTLGAENPGGVARLRIDLGDLIENRMPAMLAATLRHEGGSKRRRRKGRAAASRSIASGTRFC